MNKAPHIDDPMSVLSNHMFLLEEQVDGVMTPPGTDEFPVRTCRDLKMYHPNVIDGKKCFTLVTFPSTEIKCYFFVLDYKQDGEPIWDCEECIFCFYLLF